MATVTAHLRSLRIAPRKVRLLADSIKGMRAGDASNSLRFRVQRGAKPLLKLLNSALANAKQNAKIERPEETMFITDITVNEGKTLKRYDPRAHGRAYVIRKRASHISLTLSPDKK